MNVNKSEDLRKLALAYDLGKVCCKDNLHYKTEECDYAVTIRCKLKKKKLTLQVQLLESQVQTITTTYPVLPVNVFNCITIT